MGRILKQNKIEAKMINFTYKVVVIIAIQLVIALIHIFRLGQIFNGELYKLYYSYFSDIILPFGIYFLLCLNEFSIPVLRDWRVKAIIVFSATTTAEILQYFGIYALGITFDIIDIIMYGIGVFMAVLCDRLVFTRLYAFWSVKNQV